MTDDLEAVARDRRGARREAARRHHPDRGGSAAALIDALAAIDDRLAAAVLAVPGVEALHPGMFDEVGTYLPGRRVAGIRITDHAVDVHVVNDLRTAVDDARVSAHLRWSNGEHEWKFSGTADADSVSRIAVLQFVVPDAPGELWLDLALESDDIAATNRYQTTIRQRP